MERKRILQKYEPGIQPRQHISPNGKKDSQEAESHIRAPKGGDNIKWMVLIAVGIGTFMSALDGSVVNTTLPIIANTFGASVASIEWVVTVYLLVISGLLLSFGRLGDLHGHKTVYVYGFLIFVLGSGLSALSPSIPALIGFRAFQAIGGAILSANSPAILTKNFPASQRGQALGLQATMTYMGLTVGPSLGGWLAAQFGWQSIFLINLPVGLIALWISIRYIPKDTGEAKAESFDLIGAAAFLVGLVALLFGMDQGHAMGWISPTILASFVGAFLFLGYFVYHELRVRAPMLDLSLFRRPMFSISVVTAVFNYICIYSILFLLPFYLIVGRGYSSAYAGLLLTAQPIIMAIAAPISGTLSDRIGVRIPTALGMGILAAGLFLISLLTGGSTILAIVVALAVAGLGPGIYISPNNSALMGSAPRNRQGIAAGTLATARNVGMALGVGLSGAIFNTLVPNAETAAPTVLYHGFEVAFLVTVGIAGLGALLSLVRPSKPEMA